jgi:hypothetical protein
MMCVRPYQMGWDKLTNGDLLDAAQRGGFEVVITADRLIRCQQNLSGRRIAIVELDTNPLDHDPHRSGRSDGGGRWGRGGDTHCGSVQSFTPARLAEQKIQPQSCRSASSGTRRRFAVGSGASIRLGCRSEVRRAP